MTAQAPREPRSRTPLTAQCNHPPSYSTTSDGDAAPVNYNPGLTVAGVPFTTSADESECGVAGKTVIIHREDGTRVGCGVLA